MPGVQRKYAIRADDTYMEKDGIFFTTDPAKAALFDTQSEAMFAFVERRKAMGDGFVSNFATREAEVVAVNVIPAVTYEYEVKSLRDALK